MSINVTFDKGRCFFEGFNTSNDINPSTGRAGVNYCQYKCIGAIFFCLGLTYQIHCQKNGVSYNCYVYRKSLHQWLERHEKDPCVDNDWNENPKIKIDKTYIWNSDGAETYIKAIVLNQQKKAEYLAERIFNPGRVPSYDKIIEKAQEEFAGHEFESKILEKIKLQLKDRYKLYLERGMPLCFSNGALPLDRTNSDSYRIYWIVHDFLRSLPGVDITPYTGQYYN